MAYTVAVAQSDANKITPAKGDTLASIVASDKCEPGTTWQHLALYNWGSIVAHEVNRALVELVGCSTVDPADPEKSVLDPDLGTTKAIYIPKAWKPDTLAVEKTHTVKVRKRLPPPAVVITKLSPWFIPETETCDVEYRLEGVEPRADKVDFEVHASKYCIATAADDGELTKYTFADSEVPILCKRERDGKAVRASHSVADWKGESEATEGVLKPRGLAKAYVTVANSPYNVILRFYKRDGDKDARLVVKPFWPRWKESPTEHTPSGSDLVVAATKITLQWTNAADADGGRVTIEDKHGQVVYSTAIEGDKLKSGAQTIDWDRQYRTNASNTALEHEYYVKPDASLPDGPYVYKVTTFVHALVTGGSDESMKIEWKVSGSGDRLAHGQLLVTDGRDKVVFRKALVAADLKDHATKSGELLWDGTYSADAVKSSADGTKAIPADMPYRVQVQAHTAADQDEGLAVAAMHTEVRLWVHEDVGTETEPLAQSQCLWLDIAPSLPAEFATAKAKKGGSADEKTRWAKMRLAAMGFHPGPADTDSGRKSFTTSIQELKRACPKGTAPNFERLEVNTTVDHADTLKVLEDGADELRPIFGNPSDLKAVRTIEQSRAIMRDKDGELVVWVDDRHTITASSGGAPYDADPPDAKMRMGDYRGGLGLGDRATKDVDSVPFPWIPLQVAMPLLGKAAKLFATTSATKPTDAMRRALGPVRVDWTFTDIGEDLSVIDNFAGYNTDRTRPKKHVQTVVTTSPSVHNRTLSTNCPVANGGIRAADYYKAPFGLDADSLNPWKAADDDAAKCVATLAHADLGQAEEKLFPLAVGQAGAYLKLSKIAGDGYQFRAQAGFGKLKDAWMYPNHEVLVNRYQRLPQSHTAKMRLWRKAVYRAYVSWAASTHWGRAAESDNYYKCAFLFVADETGGATAPSALIDEAKFKEIVAARSDGTDYQDQSKMKLNGSYMWPWHDEDHFGITSVPAAGTQIANYDSVHLEDVTGKTFWRIHEKLTHELVHNVEKKLGRQLGHTMVEWSIVPEYWVRSYVCPTCGLTHLFIEKSNTATVAAGKTCKQTPSCTGALAANHDLDLACSDVGCGWTGRRNEDDSVGTYWCAQPCPGCAATTLTVTSATPIVEKGTDHLNLVGQANSLGATTILDWCDGAYWAHEFGHSRQLEHSADAPGFKVDHHDSMNNEVEDWPRRQDTCDQGCGATDVRTGPSAGCPTCSQTMSEGARTDTCDDVGCAATEGRAIGDPVGPCAVCAGPMTEGSRTDTCDQGCGHVEERKSADAVDNCPNCTHGRMTDRGQRAHNDLEHWDRACVMSYTRPDPLFFCGKCLLKTRGWDVNALTNPADNEAGP